MKYSFLVLPLLFLLGCSGLEKTEYNKIRKKNCSGEYIKRRRADKYEIDLVPSQKKQELYSWEDPNREYLPKITKDFFRCKGNPLNPPNNSLKDCEGSHRHSLPIIHGKEGIYPILLEVLNYIQTKTKQKVAITCGHRCPKHNAYSEPSKVKSLHMYGAEVDFYVKGYEDKPLDVIDLIEEYFQKQPRYKNKGLYLNFKRQNKKGVQTPQWINKEISITLYLKTEGRDFDNRHPYPYINIQVNYDRDLNEKVTTANSPRYMQW
ncbi:MAG: hypothetical protein COT84_06940 [Chlamydiae bacterium CG10_big_fil_rev_8_21_14_0_10_35_9]|nr:MAG: hypothetical protein COT84_06940 [Chlamydiae bacterium CG10_big_fil_rev_8_21_14_0_10_35_9]